MTDVRIEDYRFAALTEQNGQPVGALLTFEQASDKSNQYLSKVWERLIYALRNHHSHAEDQESCPSWAAWKPHEWATKNMPTRQKFVAWHAGVLAGFVNIQDNFPSQFHANQNIIYLEHLAAFPGYLTCGLWDRKLEGMGIPLLAFSIFQSVKQGRSGIVGLHVDGGAMKFYEKLPDILGFPVFHDMQYNVSGPEPRREETKTQAYLEVTPEAASKILESIHV
jgi:hypothetical protein